MRVLLTILGLLLAVTSSSAAELSVKIDAPLNWSTETKILSRSQKSVAVVFTAPGKRDAALHVTEIGSAAAELAGGTTLKEVHESLFSGLHHQKVTRDNLTEFTSPHGKFYLSIYEDPDLKGKPIVRDDYKYIIQITGLVDNRYVVACAVFSQEKTGKDVDEAKAAIIGMKAK